MTDIFRTMIVPEADAPLARAIADMFAGSPQNMWQAGLSPTGQEPATHYISTGGVPEAYQVMAPWQVWQQDQDGQWVMTDSYPGEPATVYAACQQPIPDTDPPEPKVPCTLQEIEALFQSADITEQDPWVAMQRLGLQPVYPPEPDPPVDEPAP